MMKLRLMRGYFRFLRCIIKTALHHRDILSRPERPAAVLKLHCVEVKMMKGSPVLEFLPQLKTFQITLRHIFKTVMQNILAQLCNTSKVAQTLFLIVGFLIANTEIVEFILNWASPRSVCWAGAILKDAWEDLPLQRRLGLDIIDQEKTLSGISAIVMVCGGGDGAQGYMWVEGEERGGIMYNGLICDGPAL